MIDYRRAYEELRAKVEALREKNNDASNLALISGKVVIAGVLKVVTEDLTALSALPSDEWISVKDRLPDVEGLYLVYHVAQHGRYKGTAMEWDAAWENGAWWSYDPWDDEYNTKCEVTPSHWRPLLAAPEPPQGKKT